MYAQLIAKHLLRINAVKLSPAAPFTWASGIKSPIYCDNRRTLAYPDVRDDIKKAFAEKASLFGEFDLIAGVATAGIPHGMLLADVLRKPFAYIRSKPKEHGMKNLIEGEMPAGARVLVVEDLISTGMSSLQAVDAVRAEGGVVIGTLAIFTYGFPDATEAFAKADCRLETLSNYGVLIETALAEGYIKAEEVDLLKRWRESPKTWGV